MDTNWCLTCSRPVPTKHSSRPAAYCSATCAQAAYSSPPSLPGTAVPHLLRAYPSPASPLSPHHGKHRTASFASTASTVSTASTTSRDEWARVRGSLSPTGASSSSSSVSSSDQQQQQPQRGVPVAHPAPGRPRASSAAYKPVSAPIHPAAASYIYQQQQPRVASLGGAGAFATFTADLRSALPPTPPKSAESVHRAVLQPPRERERTPAPSRPESEDEEEAAFHGRGHDRAYYYKASRPPPSRYAYLDPESFSGAGEPRESRDRPVHPMVGGRAKPIRIVGTDEGPGVKRLVGGERRQGGQGQGPAPSSSPPAAAASGPAAVSGPAVRPAGADAADGRRQDQDRRARTGQGEGEEALSATWSAPSATC
ncbi:hypothetical protein CALCODRAFT_301202 [Calocera cornea HHB12733]|uniref:Uncharacterized protein n=1 Tax=Calocera cornea HHB12733 TaxID=1353952 RepID=A0A165FHZ4_9BASI|nr:hypothetical protein CALCODRAFT_301202 [Calocera cornea HHB12733]